MDLPVNVFQGQRMVTGGESQTVMKARREHGSRRDFRGWLLLFFCFGFCF